MVSASRPAATTANGTRATKSPTNAVPLVGFFGTLNPTDGGNSQRYSLQAEWHRQRANSETKIMAYGFYYDLDLFSDFTYYLTDPVRGDQFEQQDRRWVAGLDARHTIFSQWFGRKVENTFGLQVRNDWIHNGLFQTRESRSAWTRPIPPPAPLCPRPRKRIALQTRKSVSMWKTKSSGRKNSAPSRPCAATWDTLTSPAWLLRPIPARPPRCCPAQS